MASPGGSDGAPPAGLQPSTSSTSSSRSDDNTTGTDLHNEAMEPASLTMALLKKITNNFSEARVLGRGAYGKVYKGVHERQEIAVKLLHNNIQAIDDEPFKREFHNLMVLKHQNIIRLVGYCYETQRQHMDHEESLIFGETTYKALCFEYMHKGSLQKYLSDECDGLDWHTRYKIIKGICEGLKYLHEGLKESFYHLDLKPDNILLDENMVPKLVDFGLSKLFGGSQTRVTQKKVGTLGYMPSEFLFKNVVSKKYDIFSLGVVMTQIIAGPSGPSRSYYMPHCMLPFKPYTLITQVQENWRKRLQATWSSPKPLEAHWKQVSRCTDIALRCMEMEDRHKRPSIVDIIDELNETEIAINESSEEKPHTKIAAPDGLLKITERVYVFDCFRTDVFAGDDKYERQHHIEGIISGLRSNFANTFFMFFDFRETRSQTPSLLANILSSNDMNLMEYPKEYGGCPLVPMETIHHFLRVGDTCLSADQHNILIMHCERGAWALLAFMLAGLLLHWKPKHYTDEQRTLEMVYDQGPRELIQSLLPLDPMPSQIRYLQYVSQRILRLEWRPGDRPRTLDCVKLRSIPGFDGEAGCRPMFRIYGQDPLVGTHSKPKVLFSTPNKCVQLYKQADCELIEIDIQCHIRGDVVLEFISMNADKQGEEMMFRVMFNTTYIRSNTLVLNRDEIDIPWDAKDRFPKEFRAEVLLSVMDTANQLDAMDSSIPVRDLEGGESAVLLLQQLNSSEIIQLRQEVVSPPPLASTSSAVRPDAPPPPPSPTPSAITSSAPPPPLPPPPPPRITSMPPPPYHSSKQSSSPIVNANPFGARRRGLARPSDEAKSRRSTLKPLHWRKATRALQGSLWEELQRPHETPKALEFDMSEIKDFLPAVPNPDARSSDKSGSHASRKPKKIHLIDLHRANNCRIMLTKVKMPLLHLMSAILALDDTVLDADQVDNLIKFTPTKEEIDLLKAYKGDKQVLGECELFFMELMKLHHVDSMLRVYSLTIKFNSQVSDLKWSLDIINSSAEEIRCSSKLKRIMEIVLSLENALNPVKGSAMGFRLDSLQKLSDTRSRNNKMTLMHYLCKLLSKKEPEVLDFPKDLASLELAAKIHLNSLAEEMQAINRGLEKVEQELSTSENDGPVSETFRKTLKEFLGGAETQVRALASLYSNVDRNAYALALYFGEDPEDCTFEKVVTTLQNFVTSFTLSHEENCKRLDHGNEESSVGIARC